MDYEEISDKEAIEFLTEEFGEGTNLQNVHLFEIEDVLVYAYVNANPDLSWDEASELVGEQAQRLESVLL